MWLRVLLYFIFLCCVLSAFYMIGTAYLYDIPGWTTKVRALAGLLAPVQPPAGMAVSSDQDLGPQGPEASPTKRGWGAPAALHVQICVRSGRTLYAGAIVRVSVVACM